MNNLKLNERKGSYVAEVELAADPTVLKNGKKIARFELSYFKGQRARGIHVWLRVLEVEQHEGYTSETFELYGGKNISAYLKLLPRKNDKQLALAAEKVDSIVPGLLEVFVSPDFYKEAVKSILNTMSEVIA